MREQDQRHMHEQNKLLEDANDSVPILKLRRDEPVGRRGFQSSRGCFHFTVLRGNRTFVAR